MITATNTTGMAFTIVTVIDYQRASALSLKIVENRFQVTL